MTDEVSSAHPSGHVLARNTLYNLVGRTLPLLVAIAAVPALIRALGVDRFGMLMLAWAVIGYSSLFDLGLGRATTRFIAHHRATGRLQELPGLVWQSWLLTAGLGVIVAATLATTTPLLIERVFRVPDLLVAETKMAFYSMAALLPVVLLTTGVRGVLEAHQRFDLINAVQVPGAIANYVLPLLVSLVTPHLGVVVVVLMVSRAVVCVTLMLFSFRVMPALRRGPGGGGGGDIMPLVRFGGWLTVSSIVSPIMEYADRVLIGALLTLTAVAYYATPYTVVSQLHLVSGSLLIVLFPAFSGLTGSGHTASASDLYRRAVKYVFLLLAPIVLVLMIFARDLMAIWIDGEFAAHSHRVVTVLAFAMLINALGRVPYGLLQAAGRPDIPAKFHLLEVLPFIVISWIAIKYIGITGAAAAWAVRAAVDAALLYWYADRTVARGGHNLRQAGGLLAVFTGLYTVAWGAAYLVPGLVERATAVGFLLLLAAAAAWRWWLEPSDRILLGQARAWLLRSAKRVVRR